MQQVGIVYDDIFLRHETGDHPESADRLHATLRTLKQIDYWGDGRLPWITPLHPRQATTHEIGWCHSPGLIQLAQERCGEAARTGQELYLDSFNPRYGETVASPETYNAALSAAGGIFTAIDAIMEGKISRAFNLCRPPGHHSDYDHARGFCLFNNIALAVNYLHNKYQVHKVAIVDFDAHAGNGTEDLYNQGHLPEDTLMISLHQHPNTLYPGTCYVNEIGEGGHRGKIANLTMAPESGHPTVKACFNGVVLPLLQEFQPEFILVSAGYDAHHADPLTNLAFMNDTYAYMTERLVSVADRFAKSRVVCTLEGGYNLKAIAKSISNTIAALGDASIPFSESHAIAEQQEVHEYNIGQMVPQLQGYLAGYWKSMPAAD